MRTGYEFARHDPSWLILERYSVTGLTDNAHNGARKRCAIQSIARLNFRWVDDRAAAWPRPRSM